MNNFHADLLIVTATKVETTAVFAAFRNATKQEPSPQTIGDKTYHYLGIVNSTQVYLVQSEMGAGGLGAAQQTVQKGIEALNPSAVIMVGIAFGVNPEKQKLGDILVSKHLMLYEPQRIGTKGKKPIIIPRGTRADCSPMLLDRCHGAEHYWKGQTVWFGLILSGEKLVDNLDFRQHLRNMEPEAIGGEMEGAGLYVACQDKKMDWILIKAICDWADGLKEQGKTGSLERQELAANNVAQFVVHVIQQVGILEKGSSQRERNPKKPHDSNPIELRKDKPMQTQKIILVVDDDPDIRRNIEKTLEREGYIVRTAGNYLQALQELEDDKFDLIVLDIIMPDWTGKLSKRAGVDVLREIRSKRITTPVIMMSATKELDLVAETTHYSVTRFFIKGNIGSKDFTKTVKELLDDYIID